MHANLAPGETLLPGAQEELRRLFAQPDVEAVLLPLVPQGEAPMPRAARRYLAAWDRRFLHRQNLFAPASRAVTRAPLAGWRNADAAPLLAQALARGARVEALPACGVVTPIARDLSSWVAHFRSEGEAWGALAARDASFAPFLPARSRGGWWRHNLRQLPRRVIEELEAVRSPAPLPLLLHLVREAAFADGCARTAALG